MDKQEMSMRDIALEYLKKMLKEEKDGQMDKNIITNDKTINTVIQ